MRWVLSASAVLILAGCRGSYEPPAPILTLIPAATRVAGPSTKVDDHTLCLMAGGSVEAPVYVHRSTATVVLVNDRVKRAPKSSRKIPPSRVKDVEFR